VNPCRLSPCFSFQNVSFSFRFLCLFLSFFCSSRVSSSDHKYPHTTAKQRLTFRNRWTAHDRHRWFLDPTQRTQNTIWKSRNFQLHGIVQHCHDTLIVSIKSVGLYLARLNASLINPALFAAENTCIAHSNTSLHVIHRNGLKGLAQVITGNCKWVLLTHQIIFLVPKQRRQKQWNSRREKWLNITSLL